ncbi:MAG TPA: response regulator [Symbiobacteriaceae bacterium]|nr:response regulator [Symbiobacteriaceae bacterium]
MMPAAVDLLGIRVLVADDEPPARSELVYLLKQQPGIAGIYEAADGVEALQQVAAVRPHALLLDIQMPRLDGLALAETLAAWPAERPQIIFSTAYDEYAVNAFELNAVDYLLKPVQAARLTTALARVRERLACPGAQNPGLDQLLRQLGRESRLAKVPVEAGGRILLLDRREIQFITTGERETVIKTADGQYATRFSLQELESRLGAPFLRVHKAFVVDLSRVVEVIPWFQGNYYLVLSDAARTQIPVGRQFLKTVQEMLGLKPTH